MTTERSDSKTRDSKTNAATNDVTNAATNAARRGLRSRLLSCASCRSATLALVLLALAPCVTSARAAGRQEKIEESVMTGAGSLDIVRLGGEDELKWELRLGKKTLRNMDDASFIHFVAHFMELNMGEVVVVSVNSGGTACPAQFQVVRIVEGGAKVSEEFGDCSDSPTITLRQLPDEEITFGFPGYYQLWQSREPGFVRPPPTTYVYKNGVLKEMKATPAKRRGRNQ